MKNLNEIRYHLRSIQQTRQITNAMYLLSTSRMKKAMTHIEYNRHYFTRVRQTMKDIINKSRVVHHPYMKGEGEAQSAAYVVIAADKGLCGGYNTNVLNLAWEHIKDHPQRFIVTAGIMATEFFRRKGVEPDIELLGLVQDPKLSLARELIDTIFRIYDEGLTDEIYVVYTHFINSTKQIPRIVRLLPLLLEDYEDVEYEYNYAGDILYEPSEEEVFSNLVPQYATGLVYGALTMSYASEHSARMTAMQNSTKNADEMIDKLSSEYNSARQYAITQEISEIGAGFQYEEE